MTHFNTPEIQKRWQPVLQRPIEIFLRKDFIVKQGQPFQHHYLIVQGEVEVFREVSSRKLGIVAPIAVLGPFDVISIDSDIANYSIRVTSYLLRAIKLKQNQRHLVSGNAVQEWRNNKADILQKQYNKQKSLQKKQKKQYRKSSLASFVKNVNFIRTKQFNIQQKGVKLPQIRQNQKSKSSKSLSNLSSKKSSPMAKHPDKTFQAFLKCYITKKIDFESKSVGVMFTQASQYKPYY